MAGLLAGFALAGAAAAAWPWLRARGRRVTPADRAALQTVIDAIPALINCKDRGSRYVFMNAFQARLYGTTGDAAVGKTAADLLGAAYGGYTNAIDRRVVERGEAVGPYEEAYADVDGNIRDWLTTKLPLFGRDGSVTHVVTVAHDISERKRAEAEIDRARRAAEAGAQSKTAFLAAMSHELRTPLNAVIGFGELIASAIHGPVGSPRYCDYARDIVASGRDLLVLIDGILDYATMERGGVPLAEAEIDAEALLRQSLRACEQAARRAQLTLAADLAISGTTLVADPKALGRAVLNLLSNAIKFTGPGGSVTLTARRESGELRIAVADTGIGMDAIQLAQALEPFKQVDERLGRRYGGLGLGLPLAKWLVERHGGRLEIASTPGRGTVAAIVLPATRLAARPGPVVGLAQTA